MKSLCLLFLFMLTFAFAKDFDNDRVWKNRYSLVEEQNDECQECLDQVNELKKKIDNPEFQRSLIDQYDKSYCSHLWKLRSTCIKIVTYMVQEFVAICDPILSNPRKLCEKAGYCKYHHRGKKIFAFLL